MADEHRERMEDEPKGPSPVLAQFVRAVFSQPLGGFGR
jgi:hypothetical protein